MGHNASAASTSGHDVAVTLRVNNAMPQNTIKRNCKNPRGDITEVHITVVIARVCVCDVMPLSSKLQMGVYHRETV